MSLEWDGIGNKKKNESVVRKRVSGVTAILGGWGKEKGWSFG